MSKNNSGIEKLFLRKWDTHAETMQNLKAVITDIIDKIHPTKTNTDIVFISDNDDMENYGATAIDLLEKTFSKDKVKIICNWVITHNERDIYFSSINKTYVEDYSKENPTLIFFSRAIDKEDFSNLVTQITRYATTVKKLNIYICTPIQDIEFNKKIKQEFPEHIAKNMQFIHCLEQSESSEYNHSLYNYTSAYQQHINGQILEEITPDVVKDRRNKRFKT